VRLWGIRIALVAAAIGCGKSEKAGKQITVQAGSGSAVVEVPADAAVVVADAAAFGVVSPTLPTKIVIGGKTTCVLLHDTSVRCWGQNDAGQVGDGTTTDAPTPVAVKGLTGVKDLVATPSGACALKADGTVACWGDKKLEPALVDGVAGAKRFVSDGCVAVADDNVVCWRAFPFVTKPGVARPVAELAKATAFLDGGLAVFADGSAKFVDKESKKLVAPKLAKAAEYATHPQDDVFCARLDDGVVKCWGNSLGCKLGAAEAIVTPVPGGGETPFTIDPVTLQLPPARQLALHATENLCVVTNESTFVCLEVGDASGKGCGKVNELAASVQSATGNCMLLGDGSVNCLASVADRRRIVVNAVTGVAGATLLASGPSHDCALAPMGLYCWGDNDRGQLGRGVADKATHPEGVVVEIR
jgi:hypothetical protein